MKKFIFFLKNPGNHEKTDEFTMNLRVYPTISTYYNYLAVTSGWTGTTGYIQFIDDMNSYLYPFLVLLLISLGLCIPKRLFEQDILIKISGLALGVTVILTFLLGMETAMGFILAVITGMQGIVFILTLNKNRAISIDL